LYLKTDFFHPLNNAFDNSLKFNVIFDQHTATDRKISPVSLLPLFSRLRNGPEFFFSAIDEMLAF